MTQTAADFSLLDLSPDATPEEIRAAYLRLAKTHHPDRNGGADPNGRFAEISNAYARLTKPYTQETSDAAGTEIIAEVPIPLSLAGGEHREEIHLNIRCPVCRGGRKIGDRACPACDGQGHKAHDGWLRLPVPPGTAQGALLPGFFVTESGLSIPVETRIQDAAHPAFIRQGLDIRARIIVARRAARLGGELRITGPDGRMLHLPMPARLKTGDQLSFDGEGTPHPAGGPAGRLILDILVEPLRVPFARFFRKK